MAVDAGDPTDRGVRVDPAADVPAGGPSPSMRELIEAAEDRRRAERPPPSGRLIERRRAGTPWARSRAGRRLRSVCPNPWCRADVGRWCVKGSRGSTANHLCDDRPEAPD